MTVDDRARLARRIMWLSFWSEIAVLTLTTWWLHQEGRQPSVTIWLIRIVPLLVFVPGMWRENLRSVVWLCFVSLLYFTLAVTEAMSPLRLWVNYLETALAVTLFTSAMLYVRWQGQSLRARRTSEAQ